MGAYPATYRYPVCCLCFAVLSCGFLKSRRTRAWWQNIAYLPAFFVQCCKVTHGVSFSFFTLFFSSFFLFDLCERANWPGSCSFDEADAGAVVVYSSRGVGYPPMWAAVRGGGLWLDIYSTWLSMTPLCLL